MPRSCGILSFGYAYPVLMPLLALQMPSMIDEGHNMMQDATDLLPAVTVSEPVKARWSDLDLAITYTWS